MSETQPQTIQMAITDSIIFAVQVYQDRAEVIREISLDPSALSLGSMNELKLTGLTSKSDEDSIRVSISKILNDKKDKMIEIVRRER